MSTSVNLLLGAVFDTMWSVCNFSFIFSCFNAWTGNMACLHTTFLGNFVQFLFFIAVWTVWNLTRIEMQHKMRDNRNNIQLLLLLLSSLVFCCATIWIINHAPTSSATCYRESFYSSTVMCNFIWKVLLLTTLFVNFILKDVLTQNLNSSF